MELKFKHFVFLNVVDIILTYYSITFLGFIEGNPILSMIFERYGLIIGLLLPKLIVISVIAVIFDSNQIVRKIGTNIICFMYVFVVANNIYQIL